MRQPKPIRWTQAAAAREFGVHVQTLRAKLSSAGAEPGEDGRYSTVQVAGALYGDGKVERAELVAISAKRAQARYRKEIGELIELSVVEAEWEDHILTAKGKIQAIPGKLCGRVRSGMSQAEIRAVLQQEVDDILGDLSKRPDYTEPVRSVEAAGDPG